MNDSTREWSPITKRRIQFYNYTLDEELIENDVDTNCPFSLFSLFVTDNIIQLIVQETNRYANQSQLNNHNNNNKRNHKQLWKPVTFDEIKRFFGILIIMGITRVPEIKLYWSKNTMYTNLRIKAAMKRDRFLDILKYLHFSDNNVNNTGNRLSKIQNVLDELTNRYKSVVKAGRNIVIDESIIPWRGRLRFRQYIPGKSHKYGIKMYKLCFPGGYTNNLEIYAGKNGVPIRKGHSHDVVMRLTSDLLNEGRTLFTDSYYTSLPLAEELLENLTYICGTMKLNRKYLPPEAKEKHKRGTIMNLQNRRGIKFMKWTDKRAVAMLTSRSAHTCAITESTNGKLKPDVVHDYNNAKKEVDLSDQISSYYNCLRKTIKWYKKVVIDLICGTSIANAWYIHQKWGNKQIDLLKFREHIIDKLINEKSIKHLEQRLQTSQKHFIEKYEGIARRARKRCTECYKIISAQEGSTIAKKKTKRVMTFCPQCNGQPAMCIKCFKNVHQQNK